MLVVRDEVNIKIPKVVGDCLVIYCPKNFVVTPTENKKLDVRIRITTPESNFGTLNTIPPCPQYLNIIKINSYERIVR